MSAKVYALICAWIVVSPAFSAAYAAARVWTWAVYAVCAAAVCTVSLLIRKRGISRVARGIFLWSAAAYILLTSAECVDSYLYHGESALTVLTLLVAAGVIGSLTRAGGSLYGMRTMGMLCCALVALIFALSLGSASTADVLPLPCVRAVSIIKAAAHAALSLSMLLLPQLAQKEENGSLKSIVVCSAAVTLCAAVIPFILPPFSMGEDSNAVIELSRNISLGRFFSRVVFAAAAALLLSTLLLISLLFSLLKESSCAWLRSKPAKAAACAACIVSAAAVAGIGLRFNVQLILAAGAVAAVIAGVLLSSRRTVRRATAAALAITIIGTFSSCMEYNEVDTLEYPLILTVSGSPDSAEFGFISESGGFSVSADGINTAASKASAVKPKRIDMSQLGLVLFCGAPKRLVLSVIGEIMLSDVHNSVLIAFSDGSDEDFANIEFDEYSGKSEFVSELREKLDGHAVLSSTAFAARAEYERTSAVILPKLEIDDDSVLLSGGECFGKLIDEELDMSALEALEAALARARISTGVAETGGETVLDLNVAMFGADKAQRERLAQLLERMYNEVGCDPLRAREKLARRYMLSRDFDEATRGIKRVKVQVG